MSDKPKILLQLDTDPQPGVFDRVVAVDSGVAYLFSYGGVKPEQVQALVHGAIFTRSPSSLKHTAIFIGGSDVHAGEAILAEVKKYLIPAYGLRVSVMLDPNGSNTTAAAAVRAATRHMDVMHTKALVLGATGPVGQRVARLLSRQGAHVRVASRSLERAEKVCQEIRLHVHNAKVEAVVTGTDADTRKAVTDQELVISSGAAGAVLLPRDIRAEITSLRMVIDLNAVPPTGIEGVEVTDKGAHRDGVVFYGAIGIGETKMKIHKAAVSHLFERNDIVLDAEEIYDLAFRVS